VDVVASYQHQILEQARRIYYETPISDETKAAYLSTPRHLFVKRYRVWGSKEWKEVTKDNLPEHIARLYTDGPLILCGDDDNLLSTLSQPSLVLRMLDMLQIRSGHNVLEVGAGSGWNAALIAKLVGPEGHVHSIEIIPEVAHLAADNIAEQAITNVSIIAGDGAEGYSDAAPYDRVIFTAGLYDLPSHFYQQTREEGLLLIVVKNRGDDNLFLLRKAGDHFESLDSMPCRFVQLRGKYQIDSLEPISLRELVEWTDLQSKEIARKRFWWGGTGKLGFPLYTLGIRSFLGITEPLFRVFNSDKAPGPPVPDSYFGLYDSEQHSLVLAKDDWLIAYGNAVAMNRFLGRVRQWVDLGMPTGANFTLQIYPVNHPLTSHPNEWIVQRNESQFVWRLPTQ